MNKEKIIKNILYKTNSDALILCSDQNRYWFTNFRSSAGYVICTRKKSYLLIDGRYYEKAKLEINNNIDVQLYKSWNDVVELFNKENIKSIVVESDYMTINELELFKKISKNTKIFDSKKLRISKNIEELDNIRKATDIAIRTINWLIDNVKAGMTEKEVANLSISKMLEFGAEKESFDTIVASGVNGSFPHHKPTDKIIREGEFVTIDMGCIYKGYCSDITRTFPIGNVENEQLVNAYNVVLEANNKGIESAKVGITGKELDSIVREVINNTEFKDYFVHSTGHGVGIDVHEYPNVSPSYNNKILNGSVITIEPGIYIPNVGGIRIEDMIYVSKNGNENLTLKANKWKK